MTEADWKTIKNNWYHQFCIEKLEVDGYTITLHVEPNKNRLEKVVYVNGFVKGKWFVKPEDHPESRFYQSWRKRFYTSKFRKQMESIWGKRAAAKQFDWNKVVYIKQTHWTSFSAFRKHYEKNFKSIELIS